MARQSPLAHGTTVYGGLATDAANVATSYLLQARIAIPHPSFTKYDVVRLAEVNRKLPLASYLSSLTRAAVEYESEIGVRLLQNGLLRPGAQRLVHSAV